MCSKFLSSERLRVLEKILRLTQEENLVLLVEGRKDKKVLEEFGFRKILTLSGKPLHTIPTLVKGEVAILTDFDREGERLRRKLLKLLCSSKLRINSLLPKLFYALGIKKLEEAKNLTKKAFVQN